MPFPIDTSVRSQTSQTRTAKAHNLWGRRRFHPPGKPRVGRPHRGGTVVAPLPGINSPDCRGTISKLLYIQYNTIYSYSKPFFQKGNHFFKNKYNTILYISVYHHPQKAK
jgi:hypothetical protein